VKSVRDWGSGSPLLSRAGDFCFRYRRALIPLVVLGLLLATGPAEALRSPPIAWGLTIAGIAVALAGQALRFFVIGFAYIKRGGKNGRIYADGLVAGGVYAHVRNPMYLGNFLMLVGLVIIWGSPVAFAVGVPLVGFLYFAIVVAEEGYLRDKFGSAYDDYARCVNRFVPRLEGLRDTLEGSRYDWRKALRKEYGTPHGLGWGIVTLILFRTLRLEGFEGNGRLLVTGVLLLVPWTFLYLAVRHWKMRGGLNTRPADA
jgi:protein-S-isoprenylcysteine O-methyltransferase Ste14